MLFEWYEQKRLENLSKHGIDFLDAKEIWQGGVLEVPSEQQEHGEQRHIAYVVLEGRIIAVVFTWRGNARRLISAWRARRDDRQDYQDNFGTWR
jgi:uncharacterized DUF497 family protein